MKSILIALLIFGSFIGHTQNRFTRLSEKAEISVITIGPGPELYDSFGHTALRVHDPESQLDIVFNYGRFDFNTPNFYTKFARGKLLYLLGVATFDDFISDYKEQRRWVKSQVLNIRYTEKLTLFDFLKNNAKQENRAYLYDFFYDNCATRPIDAINSILNNQVVFDYRDFPDERTHRKLIRENVPWNSWGSLGMDVAIGSVTDKPATKEDYLFLPNYTMAAIDKADVMRNNILYPLVLRTETLFEPTEENIYKERFITSPLILLGLLSLLLVYKTYKDYKDNKGIYFLDTTVLITTGCIGILIALLWFGTDHSSTKWNYNLLWAFPFHIIAGFVITKANPPKWIYPYMKLALIFMALLCFHWVVGIQGYAYALIPLLIALSIRYIYMIYELRKIRDAS